MIESLQRSLEIAPVMGNFHPLLPLCLTPDVETAASARAVAEELDDLARHSKRPILITEYDPRYADRFLVEQLPNCPPGELVNQMLPYRLMDARRLLTHKQIAQRIVTDTLKNRYEIVAFMLVDGLSYEDTKDWAERPSPCFIDGPSITYAKNAQGHVLPDVGFPGIVGQPPLARQLMDVGLPHSRGYSYWDRARNDVSAVLFEGMPLTKVSSITEALQTLAESRLAGLYLQIVREGTDGMAHRRREVTTREIRATIEAIHEDFRRLIRLVADSGDRGAVYLTADHGILWKNQHQFTLLSDQHAAHTRYTRERPSSSQHASPFPTHNGDYYLYWYPYIGRNIRANDSGIHGGLSYWESIVPFVHVEVNI